MESWLTIRRMVFFILGFLALGLAYFNASMVPEDRRIPHFIGGSMWAVLFFAIAVWPRRKPRQEPPSERLKRE
ncbi:MAG: hypothetical protein ACRC8S_06925 [Fimbriiglobus sp.]